MANRVVQSSASWWSRWFLRVLGLLQAALPTGWPQSYDLRAGDTFDFIVVGAGSGGAAVATRLSEISHWRVLLIEAGGDPTPISVIPGLFLLNHITDFDWGYRPQLDEGVGEAHNNRTIFLTRGRGLGGCSSVNYQIYARGVAADYDEWEPVAPGWGWDTALHYFKKLETMTDPSVFKNPHNTYLHSSTGPVLVSRQLTDPFITEANDNYLDSLKEMGVKRVLENNGPDLGGAPSHFTFSNGRRSSTAEAYLKPTKDRPNLYITKFARVTKVLIDADTNRAYGVEVLLNSGKMVNVMAEKEIIVSAGAINTPQLLMLSGIGPKEELQKHEIAMIADLPVGTNLHDHQITPMIFAGEPGLRSAILNFVAIKNLDTYPLALVNVFFKLNNSRSNYASERPDIQIVNLRFGAASSLLLQYICKVVVNYDDQLCYSLVKSNLYRAVDFSIVTLLHPVSRGRVTLRSRNPLDPPNIELGYFRDDADEAMMMEAVKYMAGIVDTSYYRKNNGYVARLDIKACKGLKWATDAYWRCYVKNTVTTLWHPVGTCSMGPHGVVDERLRVHGVLGLRVVDASVMPEIVSGNTNTPTMMIGEHGADLIKSEYLTYH